MKNFTLLLFSLLLSFAVSAQTITEIQGTGDVSPYADQVVTTTGIITGYFYNGFVIQDGPSVDGYNGIFVYIFDWLVIDTDDIDEKYSDLVVGAEVTITAVVTEYYGVTELVDLVLYTVNSTGNALPEPVLLTTAGIADEKYECVLVKIANAEVTNVEAEHGYFQVDDGSGVAEVDDNGLAWRTDEDLLPAPGQVYNMTGVVFYTWDKYRLEPFTLEDIQLVTSIEEDNLSNNYSIYPNPVTNDYFSVLSDEGINSIEVFNVIGQTVFEMSNIDHLTNVKVNLNNPNEGVYMVKLIFADNTSKIRKIMVK